MQNERWVDQEQAERFTGRSRVTLWHWRAVGKLPFKKIGNQVFFPVSALRKLKGNPGRSKSLNLQVKEG